MRRHHYVKYSSFNPFK